MKSFFEWFKASTKVKRWILLILCGIILTCYGIAKILVSEEITFFELGKTIFKVSISTANLITFMENFNFGLEELDAPFKMS